MKTLTMMLIYLGTFMLMFLILSCIGMLWEPYREVISNPNWFIVYTIFLGWWLAMFPTMEYYNLHKKYFNEF